MRVRSPSRAGSFGLGIGAFGEGFGDCRERFGEFLAAGGCAITLPTNDLHALPDYVVEAGALVPRVEALYALTGAGDFPWMVRFDASPSGRGKVALSELLDAAFELAQGEIVAFVILSETAGLVGATLRRSPATGPVSLDFPSVRDWISFTTERTADRSLALLVGVAARNPPPEAAAFLRPVNGDAVACTRTSTRRCFRSGRSSGASCRSARRSPTSLRRRLPAR